MSKTRLPIKTVQNGNIIAKTCVEDVYKICNRVFDAMDKAYNDSSEVLDSIFKEYDGYSGHLIIGTGVSQPCSTDVFDEEIGNNIAFMKAKLNANIKKHNFLSKIYYNFLKTLCTINEDLNKVDKYIKMDLDKIRLYNKDYLNGIEDKLYIV